MTDTDRPRRGTSDDDNSTSDGNSPEADGGSSSVEKAAEKLSRAQDILTSQSPPDGRAASDQTSSIERFLNANDGDVLGAPGAGPNVTDDGAAAIPAELPVSPATGPAPDIIPEAVAKSADPVQPPVYQPTAGEPVQQTPEQTDPIYQPARAQENFPTREDAENPYRAAHPGPENLPQTEAGTAIPGAGDIAPVPQKRGLFRRKRAEPKPWHRDQAEERPARPADAAPATEGQPEMPPKKRGVLGMVWGMVRFMLIGKKRPKKATASTPGASTPGAPRRRGAYLPSRISAGLSGARRRFQPLLATRIGRIPGLRRLTRTKAEVVAEIERVAAETPAGIAEIAAETRRSTAGSHIQRPLDMSRRVGRSVEIDIEKIRAAGMVTPSGERTHIAEEFRLIKRPLLLNAFEKGANAIRNGNVIMVASSRSGEGKTFMAVNLAMSIASERDLTVLLIDADVAKPDIPNVLGFEADLGLVDLIADDRIDMSQVIMRTNIENLSVMPAGRPHHLATELLASERMGNLVSELSLRYPERVVIMDSPPALLSSVAGVLALNVGQTLFVVEAERTAQSAVDSAIGLVSACKNINLLLNKSRPLGGGERFGSYQSSYY